MFFTKYPTWVDVGGTGDCGFRSVAAAMIDDFLDKDTNCNDWSHTLKIFFAYYDQHSTQKNIFPKEYQSLSSTERMHFLVKEYKKNMSALVILVAFNLRQLSVNQLVAEPYKYLGAFVAANENTSIKEMRKINTYIDESAIAALANVLDINIKVSVTEPNKELPLALSYNAEAKKSVQIQLMNQHYKPKIKNASLFQATPKLLSLQNPLVHSKKDPDMPEILAKIEEGIKKDKAIYEEAYDTLSILIADGELSKTDLLDFYVNSITSNDYFQGFRGLENGSEGFFKNIKHNPRANFNDQITRELVHALARASSHGLISLDKLMDGRLETKSLIKA